MSMLIDQQECDTNYADRRDSGIKKVAGFGLQIGSRRREVSRKRISEGADRHVSAFSS